MLQPFWGVLGEQLGNDWRGNWEKAWENIDKYKETLMIMEKVLIFMNLDLRIIPQTARAAGVLTYLQ